jgi:hypothetical protein
MKPATKHILIALGIGAGVFVVYEMYKAISAGVTAAEDILLAPWNALKSVWSGVSGAASAVSSTVANVSAGNAAATQISALNNSQYAPGGTIYNQIQATQGTAAADAAWQTVQNNQAVQASQTVTWDPLTWF